MWLHGLCEKVINTDLMFAQKFEKRAIFLITDSSYFQLPSFLVALGYFVTG